VIKYLISKYYAFFSANVMLITISIILFIFLIYHISLIKEGNTSNEQLKRSKNIKYMKIIKTTLNNMIKQKKIEIKPCPFLTDDNIKKYKKIVFESNIHLIKILNLTYQVYQAKKSLSLRNLQMILKLCMRRMFIIKDF
jgi:hypothetical protein